ncbi:MAG: hydrogenase 4 subunit B [Allosphingosinicella sp.]
MTIAVFLSGIAALLALSIAAIPLARRPAGSTILYGSALALSMLLLGGAITHLVSGADPVWIRSPLGLPWIGSRFRLDALSAFFLAVANLGGSVACLYATGGGAKEPEPQRVLPFFPAFLAAMNLVVLADDAFTFLLSWEFMSLTSWALVMAHHRERGNAHAGYVYIVMAAFGTLALLLAFGLLAGPGGGYDFATMRAREITPAVAGLVLALVLLGAGSKAGIVPLHVWLPLAHPAAPSHVSALMSGVMTKVAIYGFVRIVFDLLDEPSWWSGLIVLFLGGITAVLGVLYALMQHDLKRLLAYHTVENIGIIYIGLGLALAFRANGMGSAAALALTAALFHVLNHSLFKSLLFLGAGAVLGATGERDMEKLGGLARNMPYTSFVFLIGCVAISALPPLNGFVSEWLTFQAVLLSPDLPQWALKIMTPAMGGLLALSAALAAACFVKAYGVTFLGRPRSEAAREARETDAFSLAAMSVLAILCLMAGILPGFVIDTLGPTTLSLVGERMPVQASVRWLSIVPIAESRSSYNGLLVFAFVVASACFAALVIHRVASNRLRRTPAWDCGFPDPSPTTQYSASSFAQPIRRVFGTSIFRAREEVSMPPPGDGRPARLTVTLRDLAWELIYVPLARGAAWLSERLNHLQFLTIRQYLSLVFAVLVFLLVVLASWQ